eukprot:comp20115_c0_seq1/m.24821 comp20115_c0_seq1/g.24821  ORF comp20115_c0_seq1/g.24821 comp20115_c0_seq1/m.24821 type:complete len:770 (-) comp20115_c0_seq1:276-2585(-)
MPAEDSREVATHLEEPSVLDRLREDGAYGPFLEGEFNVEKYTASIIASAQIEECLSKLKAGIDMLDSELHQQVAERHQDLIQQAMGIQKLEDVLGMVNTRVASLQTSIERIRTRIDGPYNEMVEKTRRLSRLQNACELLRRVIRYLHVTQRLRVQLAAGDRELAKAALSLAELDDVTSVDLSGLHVVDSENAWVARERENVQDRARNLLNNGLEAQNQADIGTALQVFYNLGLLGLTVNQLIESTTDRVCMEIRSLSAPPLEKPGQPATKRDMWPSIEKLLNLMYSSYAQVYHLEKVLSKKRDPTTHVCFLDEVVKSNTESKALSFWTTVSTLFANRLEKLADEYVQVRHTLEGEYPKLLRNWNTTKDRLLVLTNQQGEFPLKCQARFESVYLSRGVSRMLDNVNMMFSGGKLCTRDELQGLSRIMKSELQVASVDRELLLAVARNIGKALRMVVAKAEALVSVEGDAVVFSSTPSPSMVRNIEIVNMVHMLVNTLQNPLDTRLMSGPPQDSLKNSVEELTAFTDEVLRDYYRAADSHLLSVLLRMHQVNFAAGPSRGASQPDAPCSAYMEDLGREIGIINTTFLQRFTPSIVAQWRLKLAGRLTELFVRHLSLVRPISDGGKLKLAADMAQFEMTIAPLLDRARIAEIGAPYKQLRSFRPLVFVETSALDVDGPTIQSLDPITVLHHLFSRAPNTLQSPYARMQWTLTYYSQWLGSHPPQEALGLIQASLDSYAGEVTRRGEKEFAPVYPIMVKMLRKAYSSLPATQQ